MQLFQAPPGHMPPQGPGGRLKTTLLLGMFMFIVAAPVIGGTMVILLAWLEQLGFASLTSAALAGLGLAVPVALFAATAMRRRRRRRDGI